MDKPKRLLAIFRYAYVSPPARPLTLEEDRQARRLVETAEDTCLESSEGATVNERVK